MSSKLPARANSLGIAARGPHQQLEKVIAAPEENDTVDIRVKNHTDAIYALCETRLNTQ